MEFSKDKQGPARVWILTLFVAESIGQSYFSNQLSFPLSTEIYFLIKSFRKAKFVFDEREENMPVFLMM